MDIPGFCILNSGLVVVIARDFGACNRLVIEEEVTDGGCNPLGLAAISEGLLGATPVGEEAELVVVCLPPRGGLEAFGVTSLVGLTLAGETLFLSLGGLLEALGVINLVGLSRFVGEGFAGVVAVVVLSCGSLVSSRLKTAFALEALTEVLLLLLDGDG